MFANQIEQKPRMDNGSRWKFPQYSIRTLLIVTLVAAIGAAMVAAPFFAAIVAIGISLIVGGATVIAIIFARGWLQAFAIGYLPVFAFGSVMAVSSHHPAEAVIFWFIAILSGIFSGTGAATMRSYLATCNGLVDVSNVPILKKMFNN